MSDDVPTIELMDEQTAHVDGEFTEVRPVKIHTETKEQAREVAQVFTEAWKNREEE
jgi:diacylglycerol kinase family enzyme